MLPQSICQRIRKIIPIQFDLSRVIHSVSSLTICNGRTPTHLCVCFLEHRLIVRRHTIICEERRYHINRITPAGLFYVDVGERLGKLPNVRTKAGAAKPDGRSHHHSSLVPPVQRDIEPERSQHPHNHNPLVGRFGNLSNLQSRPQCRRLRDPPRWCPL
jgi:hypothetical protein